jgi:hypothetical protein
LRRRYTKIFNAKNNYTNLTPGYRVDTETTEWGAPNITADMFVDESGIQKPISEIYTTLDPILTGITGTDLVDYINDLLPKYTGVSPEEKEFAKEGYKADIYGLRPEVGGAITPTTGVGARGKIASTAGIKKGFEAAGKAHEKSIYKLEEGVKGAFETGIVSAIGEIGETAFAETGDEPLITPYESIYGRRGGKVPEKGKETFLDFLTQLPDAGGI